MHQEQIPEIHFCNQKLAICLDQQCDDLSDCCQECILTVHQNHNWKTYQEISQYLENVEHICLKYEEKIESLQFQISSLIKACQSWLQNQKVKTLQIKKAIEEQSYSVINDNQDWLLFWLSNIDNNNQIKETKSNIFRLFNDRNIMEEQRKRFKLFNSNLKSHMQEKTNNNKQSEPEKPKRLYHCLGKIFPTKNKPFQRKPIQRKVFSQGD